MGDVLRLAGGQTQQPEQVLDRIVEVGVVEGALEPAAERADHGTAEE
jgi:hypothetical protein